MSGFIVEWCCGKNENEMVSLGDTAISLHILQPARGVFWKVKTQSAKICLNFNFRGGGGGCSGKSNPKCQDLPKFQFSRGGGGVLEPNSRTGVF